MTKNLETSTFMYSDISDFFRNMTSTSFTLSLTALATDLQTVGVPQTCFSGNNSRHHITSVKQFLYYQVFLLCLQENPYEKDIMFY